jgi:hypothetical protein
VGDAQIRNLHTLLRAAFGQALRWEPWLAPSEPRRRLGGGSRLWRSPSC